MTDLITTLEQQEQELAFDAFDHADAWRLGSRITAIAQESGHKVGIDIRRPGLILFRAALPGITPDQAVGWLGADYAVTGGAFPIRVRGVGVVAAATASGLSSMEDHDLIVTGIRAHLAEAGK
ncbi:heme-binding protein [Nonomuraea jabiensis]|uniref:heme-binding protein n=1 Tax=Nonomuraea jabiensis TaxID=882448 RepID=UPI003D719973